MDVNKKGRYVRISLAKDPRNPRKVLNLTEVQVFGKATNQPTSPDPFATKPITASTGNSSTPPDPFSTKPTTTNVAAVKYQTAMKPGDKLLEGEKVASANGKFQLRGTSGGDFVIEEVQSGRVVYTFPLGSPFGDRPAKSFLIYGTDGNICIQSTQNKSYCITNGRDAVAPVVLNKSGHAELTDGGRLRLIGTNGEEIWATTPATTTISAVELALFVKTKSSLLVNERLSNNNETLTSDNNQYQCRITPQNQFIIEKITVSSNDKGQQVITGRVETWNRPCMGGYIQPVEGGGIPDCFRAVLVPENNTQMRWLNLEKWKLEDDGTIKLYSKNIKGSGTKICPIN